MSRSRRMAMVNRGHPKLSVVKQCRLLRLSRSSVYYRRKPTRPADLELMASMDRQYLKTPYYGSRRMTAWLQGSQPPGTSDPPQAQYQQACAGTQDIPLLAEKGASRQGQSGLGSGHHLPAHGAGVPLSGGHYGLAQPVRAVLEALQHPGGGLLHQRSQGGSEQRTAGDLQHRPEPAPAQAGGSQFTGETFSGLLLERGSRSAWMARADTWTTSLWSVCGGA